MGLDVDLAGWLGRALVGWKAWKGISGKNNSIHRSMG